MAEFIRCSDSYRTYLSNRNNLKHQIKIELLKGLRFDEISDKLGVNEKAVRSLTDEMVKEWLTRDRKWRHS